MVGANSCKGVILLILLALIVAIHWWHNKHGVMERSAKAEPSNSASALYITKIDYIDGVPYLKRYYHGDKTYGQKSHISIQVIISVKAERQKYSDLRKCSDGHFGQILKYLKQSSSADTFLNKINDLIDSPDFSGFAVNIKVVGDDGREISQINNALEQNLQTNPRQ